MAHKPISPKQVNNFLDSCAFNPQGTPEEGAAKKIRELGDAGVVNLVMAHSVQREIDHPNTPADVKQAATATIYTLDCELNSEELKRKAAIHAIMTGNGKPEKYIADATHIFEAGKYGGYFITTDARILERRKTLEEASGVRIFRPTEWLKLLNEGAA
jgi:hypothetical protein